MRSYLQWLHFRTIMIKWLSGDRYHALFISSGIIQKILITKYSVVFSIDSMIIILKLSFIKIINFTLKISFVFHFIHFQN